MYYHFRQFRISKHRDRVFNHSFEMLFDAYVLALGQLPKHFISKLLIVFFSLMDCKTSSNYLSFALKENFMKRIEVLTARACGRQINRF